MRTRGMPTGKKFSTNWPCPMAWLNLCNIRKGPQSILAFSIPKGVPATQSPRRPCASISRTAAFEGSSTKNRRFPSIVCGVRNSGSHRYNCRESPRPKIKIIIVYIVGPQMKNHYVYAICPKQPPSPLPSPSEMIININA